MNNHVILIYEEQEEEVSDVDVLALRMNQHSTISTAYIMSCKPSFQLSSLPLLGLGKNKFGTILLTLLKFVSKQAEL